MVKFSNILFEILKFLHRYSAQKPNFLQYLFVNFVYRQQRGYIKIKEQYMNM